MTKYKPGPYGEGVEFPVDNPAHTQVAADEWYKALGGPEMEAKIDEYHTALVKCRIERFNMETRIKDLEGLLASAENTIHKHVYGRNLKKGH